MVLFILFPAVFHVRGVQHVYLVYHATVNGRTGHTGIAVDNYYMIVREELLNGKTMFRPDTLSNGTLTYYDFWTKNDQTDKKLIFKDQVPKYYKLPLASWEPEITFHYLLSKGMPYHYGYSVDGLIRITTSPAQDIRLKEMIDSLMAINRPFHAINWNCSDFARWVIEQASGEKIRAKEFVWTGFSSTPNKLFREVSGLNGTVIMKDPGKVVYGSFLFERIWKGLFKSFYENDDGYPGTK